MAAKAVIFDLDGTLAEFNLDYKAVRAEAKQFLMSQGLPSSVLTTKESIFEMLKKAKVFMRNLRNGEHQFDSVREKVLSIASRYELAAAGETSLLPGVIETLRALKKMQLKLGIFTINGRRSTNRILEIFRLEDYFDAVVTREAVLNVKPDPTHLSVVLSALNVKASEAVVVGDSVVDMKAARALNSVAIGLAADGSAVKRLNLAGASHVISSLIDLLPLMEKLSSGIE